MTPTELLEHTAARLLRERDEARQQRDELLAACKDARTYIREHTPVDRPESTWCLLEVLTIAIDNVTA